MQFTLISPRLAVQKGDFLGSGVPYWPVELAVAVSFLRERNHQVKVLDLFGADPSVLNDNGDYYLQGIPIGEYLSDAAVTEADAFIIYAISYMSHSELLTIGKELKQAQPNKPVFVLENSQAVTSYALPFLAEQFFQNNIDGLICGEPYHNWDEIERYIAEGGDVPENVCAPGLAEGRLVKRQIEKESSYPVPAWDLFNLEGYWSLPYSHGPKKRRKFLPILTSRGCPYPCDFCVVPELNTRRWRGRDPEEVVNEIIFLRDKFDVHYFQVEDLNPTVQGVRWERISELLIERKAEVFFSFVSGTKVETLKLEALPLLAKAGCYYISISPESGSSDVLKAIGKPFDHEHALRVINACHKLGIYTQACILVGHPAEREIDHQRSCEYIRKLVRAGLDEVAVFVVSSYAGSRIYRNNSLAISSQEALPSFSPKGRENWQQLQLRRRELIRIFFIEKLKRGLSIWAQGVRALAGVPRTKMENLPRRIVYIYWISAKAYFRRILAAKEM